MKSLLSKAEGFDIFEMGDYKTVSAFSLLIYGSETL